MPDFKSMLAPLNFGKHAAEDVPKPHLRRAESRRVAMLKEAAEILSALPGPGESLSLIQSGRYDLADAIDAILSRLGTARHLRVATLSFSARNTDSLGAGSEPEPSSR